MNIYNLISDLDKKISAEVEIDDKNNKDNKDDKDILVIKRKDKDNIPTKTIEEDEEIDWNDL